MWRSGLGGRRSPDGGPRRAGTPRWVVVDVETAGLDPARDALLAIGGVAVRDGRIDVGDSFERVVRPTETSPRDNILVHGIGEGAQRDGADPADACRAFLDWAGEAPRVAFHAAFDRTVLDRAVRAHLGAAPKAGWLDLAALAPVLNPDVRASALDDWLVHFAIPVERRHNAGADAFATAMLFLRLLAQVPAAEREPAALRRLAGAGRWVR
jgi:DNA polymerase-3 subunit epsilon